MFTPLPFDEAIDFFKDKVKLSPDEYQLLIDSAKSKAFTVAGVSKMSVLEDIHGALQKAIEKGTTLETFKTDIADIMARRGWTGTNPWHLETIFRTNIQSSYMAGHYAQNMQSVDNRPYWQYLAIMDSRVRPRHAAMNGKVYRYDDPFWKTSYPPNGFNCRCSVRTLTAKQVEQKGLNVDKNGPDVADKGFSGNVGTQWQTKLLKTQPEIAREAIKEFIKGPDFDKFIKGDLTGHFPIAVLNHEYQALMKTQTPIVLLSDDTISKQLGKTTRSRGHLELTIEEYKKIPDIIDKSDHILQSGDQILIFISYSGRNYQAVVKATKKGEALFLTSFRRIDEVKKEIERLKRNKGVIEVK